MSSLLEELRRKAAAGEYAAALNLAQELLQEPDKLTPVELAEAARTGAGAAMGLGAHHKAMYLVEMEQQHAVTTDDPVLIAIASFHRGTVNLYVGNASDALESFATFAAIDTPSRPGLDRYRAGCWFNTGSVHMQRREYQRAVGALAEARAVYAAQGNPHGVIDCLLNEAWALLLAGIHDTAAQRLGQATALLSEHPDADQQLSCICHRAFYHYTAGEYDRATALCQEVFQVGRAGIAHHHTSEAAWIAGECGLALGVLDEAAAMAATASSHALKAGWSTLINRANDLRGRIRAAAGEQTA